MNDVDLTMSLERRCERIRELDRIQISMNEERHRLYHAGLTREEHNRLISMVEDDGLPHII